MNTALLILHVFLSLGIITLVLLQKGAGASAGAAFGGGGAGSVFGASGSSNFLSKSTAILATGFFLNSIALAYLAAHRDVSTDSVMDALTRPKQEVVTPAPAKDSKTTDSGTTGNVSTDIIPAPDAGDKAASSATDTVDTTKAADQVDQAGNKAPATDIVPPAPVEDTTK